MRVIGVGTLGVEALVAEVARVTRGGGVVVFPTDTVYGIGCDPGNAAAVARVFSLKGRVRTKPLALHVADVESFLRFAGENGAARALAQRFLPGPLTVIVARPAAIARDVTAGMATLGLRVPDHPLCRAILTEAGPLAATSANFSGRPAYAGRPEGAELPAADLFVDDGVTALETESTVIDVSQEPARIVRAGAVPTAMLEKVLGIDLQ